MARTSDIPFDTVRSEGGLLPPDLLTRVVESDPALGGLVPADYGLARGERLNDVTAQAWRRCQSAWVSFRDTTEQLQVAESGVTETREQWILPLFRSLGYGRLTFRGSAEVIDDRPFPVSHRAGENEDAPPVHIVSFRQNLDRGEGKRQVAGGLGVSPHGLMQDYLNRTPHLWGVVTNGLRLRLLRDNESLTRPAYVEFDLETMMGDDGYADFVLLYLILHRTRLPRGQGDAAACWLERWATSAVTGGARALDALRAGVQVALMALGEGFIAHPANEGLRVSLVDGRLTVRDYYRQLLRMVYRLLFLLVAEERDLIFTGDVASRGRDIYYNHYSVSRLRERVRRIGARDTHGDIWRALRKTFEMMQHGSVPLDLSALSGGLFDNKSCPDLDLADLSNGALLACLGGLFSLRVGGVVRRVNYRDLNVEELGSVYESLLDFHPVLIKNGGPPHFELVNGGERKATGSYYTPSALVTQAIKGALDPVIAQALAGARSVEEKRANLLALNLCDAACGSGHFLLAAARRLGRELARIDAGESEPDLITLRRCTREVITTCIYGVDLNPFSVDLCKLALWIEAHTPGSALIFLDHRIKRGNALVGATPETLDNGIPVQAFFPVTGDDKAVAAYLRKRNKKELTGQQRLRLDSHALIGAEASDEEAGEAAVIGAMGDENAVAVELKQRRHNDYIERFELRDKHLVCDVWTAAFFWPLADDTPEPPSQDDLHRLRARQPALTHGQHEVLRRLSDDLGFFHWTIEYPDVFKYRGGFDCVLGNPPWERIKLQEQEFFAERSAAIAKAPNAAVRKQLIGQLTETDGALADAFEAAKHDAEAQGKFVHESGRFPLTGVGDVNLYALFAEQFRNLLNGDGYAGLICPTGSATDDSTRKFFSDLTAAHALVSLFDFENSEGIFPSVHRSYKFCVLTTTAKRVQEADYTFFCTNTSQLEQPERHFNLSTDDIALLNPNTRTCPLFRTQADTGLTKKLYRTVPVLVNERTGANPWNAHFLRMFDMAGDSGLFRTRKQLGDEDWVIDGNSHHKGGAAYVPLYEAKLLHQYDHRWATYDPGEARDSTTAEKADPYFSVKPRYWVPRVDVEERLGGKWDKGWMLAFRDIARSTDERTVIFSLLPRVGIGHTAPLVLSSASPYLAACLVGNTNSLVLDYVTRQKVGGTHLSYGYLKQLPVLPPDAYSQDHMDYIVPRVLELVYTAWDMQPFAQDLGFEDKPFEWDAPRRAVVRAELDAYYAQLYGLSRKQLRYILDPHDLTDRELSDILGSAEDSPDEPRTESFPGQTFRVLKEREIKQHGEYRTKRLVLEAWERLRHAGHPDRWKSGTSVNGYEERTG